MQQEEPDVEEEQVVGVQVVGSVDRPMAVEEVYPPKCNKS